MPKAEWRLFRRQGSVAPFLAAFQMDSCGPHLGGRRMWWLEQAACCAMLWAGASTLPDLRQGLCMCLSWGALPTPSQGSSCCWIVLQWERLFSFYHEFLDYLWPSNGFLLCCNAYGFMRSLLRLFIFYAQTDSVPRISYALDLLEVAFLLCLASLRCGFPALFVCWCVLCCGLCGCVVCFFIPMEGVFNVVFSFWL